MSNTNKIVMHYIPGNFDAYTNKDGWSFKREYGLDALINTGLTFAGQWVFRKPDGQYIDHDGFRSDLAERNNVKLT